MNGHDILNLAKKLFASSRAIVGRSYYAAYHLSLALFADLGLPRTSDHKIPARWLVESGEPNARAAGRLLEDLYASRRRADYDLEHPTAVRESRDLMFVKAQIEMATDVKSLLARCSVEPTRSQVQSGIRAFIERTTKTRGNG
jgi:hypothetical protein